MNLVPRIIPGSLSNANKDAIDWGFHGLVAYGCQSTIVVIEPHHFQIIQCMEKHKEPITKVKWAAENYYHNHDNPYSLKLASADTSGNILIWDVYKATVQSEFHEGKQPVADMSWYIGDSNLIYHLLVLHTPNQLVLWNCLNGTKVWGVTYSDTLLHIAQDLFNVQRCILLGQNSIILIEDLSLTNSANGQARRFYISNSNKQQSTTDLKQTPSLTSLNGISAAQLTTKIKTIIEGENKKQDDLASIVSLNDCIQILFHPLHRHLILIVYPREILIFDLEICQTVGTILCDKHVAAFYKIYACKQRDIIICLHESGTISIRIRHIENSTLAALQSTLTSLADFVIDVTYDLICFSDAFRLSKNTKICSFAVSPSNETTIGVILTDGRLLLWTTDKLILKNENLDINNNRIPLYGLMFAGPSSSCVIQMCPPMTSKNWRHWQALLAVGCSNGDIVLFDLNSGMIQRQMSIHSCTVRGVVWLSTTMLLSWAYHNTDGRSLVRNEVFIVNIQSDGITLFFYQHVIVYNFKEWSTNIVSKKKATDSSQMNNSGTESELELTRRLSDSSTIDAGDKQQSILSSPQREHFIFTDEYNLLYHFYVEARVIKEIATVPPDSSSATVTDIALKGDFMLSGDTDGILHIWNIKEKQTRSFPTRRGSIRKVRFAPGKGNYRAFVLFNDGLDIWDLKDNDRISSLKYPRDTISINDCDWACSDKPILACSDYCFRIYEMNLVDSSTSLEFQTTHQSFFCPHFLPSRTTFLLKQLLCIQPWNNDNQIIFDFKTICDDGAIENLLNKEITKLDSDVCKYLSNTKSIVERCSFVAKLFNDQWEIRFWRLCEYYLFVYGKSPDDESIRPSSLPFSYDLLLDKTTFEHIQLERAIRHDVKCTTKPMISHCINTYLYLKQIDRAVHLLLDTDPDDTDYAMNCIKACLITSLQNNSNNSTSKNTVTKLVATNLIANSKVDEGIQLLSTIDMCAEACRYLQDHNQWDKAAWLAKVRLGNNEYIDVMKRWAEHLRIHSTTQQMTASLILISCGQFRRAIEVLHGQNAFELAVRLLMCCKQFQIEDCCNENNTEWENKLYDDYANYMQSNGFSMVAKYYRTKISSFSILDDS
ncbi:unnamed protein product [Didymodactylos carnosus]|uniref:WD repeat-containing protein 11 n=1 Tax=Didymodactylos carnosus TaxID=1234261 RepID=A0A814F725_9BILA|nr:unnamed protein product [Didymodactylos carnosus]CAF0977427.1 unnamed protein product [Didymodactylos carnosus]CAF3635980.1 unnamed protein product [Didymodactylos carnosus]CAF3750273.1 unnamed protein product [Didymodactylos carnosus]